MVINDLRKFIFIHIPKNAGTSIARMLLKHFDNNNSAYSQQHTSLKQIGNKFPEQLLILIIVLMMIYHNMQL